MELIESLLLFTIFSTKYGADNQPLIHLILKLKRLYTGLEERENDQLEQVSNASHGLDHDGNEDQSFKDEEDCKTPGGVPMTSDERQL